jgi:acyl-CoA synthetase (AMP-forming)/AMP-acid ligase II
MVDSAFVDLLPVLPDRESRCAIFDPSGAPLWSRAEFRQRGLAWAEVLRTDYRALVFLLCQNEATVLAALYGALAAGHAVALLDGTAADGTIRKLVGAYSPEFVIGAPDLQGRSVVSAAAQSRHAEGLEVWEAPPDCATVAPELALLLATSGTTGSSKFVRLSAKNLLSNARQITKALDIGPYDVGAAHLPVHYSYGLSVITSHLLVGAAVHLWSGSVTTPDFWESSRRAGSTQFPGVPFHYDFLARSKLATFAPPSLKVYTQAGGALNTRLKKRIHQMTADIGAKFYVMYGQTEASPRITTLPDERLNDKLGSVGVALDGGRLSIVDDDDVALLPGETGRVIYTGPNVMLGYAETRSDLGLPDVTGGVIETGDLGYLDDEGFLYLTGRAKRIAKPFGLRISLDEVEGKFAPEVSAAAVSRGDTIVIYTNQIEAATAIVQAMARDYKLPTSIFRVVEIDVLPRKPSGKIDYAVLEGL